MYKWNPRDYTTQSSNQQHWAQELIPKLALKGNERVLDIGCGDGKVTAEIASHVPSGSVLGIDSSKEMVMFARDKFPYADHPNLAFKHIDARELDFNREFDIVFSNAALHWIVGHRSVLKGIKKSLKPSGKILLQMGGKGNAASVFEILDKLLKNGKWSRYFEDFSFPYGFYGLEEYRVWLDEAGLEAKRIELIPKDMKLEGKKGLSGFIRSTWLPYTRRIPEDLHSEFIDSVTEKYLETYPVDKDGIVHIGMIRLEVEAEKCINS
ncbi:methyltransferase domain-containing protein [Methanomethylovorans sp.]|uniref:class I SAM-dependent methyltransferase n=1 Tax=Methanomethylovorans sp. TaxID=2758717 RepID=UPI00351CA946